MNCKECGHELTTEEQIQYLQKQINELKKELKCKFAYLSGYLDLEVLNK